MAAPLNVGIAGLGTVGASVVRLLERQREALAARCGRPIVVVAASARSRGKKRAVDLGTLRWVADPVALAGDREIDVFVELIGGEGNPARAAVAAALTAGKSVVTANKALLARHGLALAALAEKNHVALNFEAAVGGAIPIVNENDTVSTAAALMFYAPGLLGYSAVKIASPTFYSLRDARTPVTVSVISIAANLAINLVLVQVLGYRGLALGTAMAALINAVVLLWLLRGRIGGIDGGRVAVSMIKIVAASLVMALSVIIVHPREIVQFIVYLAAACLVLLFIRRHRPVATRAAILLGATAVTLVVYREWHQWAVPTIDPLVALERRQLVDLFRGMTWSELFGSPLPLVDAPHSASLGGTGLASNDGETVPCPRETVTVS